MIAYKKDKGISVNFKDVLNISFIQILVAQFLKDFIYLSLERGEGKREGEKQQCVVAFHVPPTGDLACNPGMCPRLRIEQVTL